MPKVALSLVKGNSYFCDGFLSIGVYVQDEIAILIDSGNDESCAKDVHNAILAEGYEVAAIINTHCHPDHCGGNYSFQKRILGLRVYSAHDEKEFIEDPNLAPRCFCGGAAAFSGLKNKYIAPQKPSVVTDVISPYQDQSVSIKGINFKLVTLPGHTPGSLGIITPDNVLYVGDAVFGEETFRKHPVLFYTDIGNTLISLRKLATLKVDACVLYHGGVIHDLPAIVQQHEARILEIKDTLLSLIRLQAASIDTLTQQIMQTYKISDNIISFTLTQTAVRAYITQLECEKFVQLVVSDGLLRVMTVN